MNDSWKCILQNRCVISNFCWPALTDDCILDVFRYGSQKARFPRNVHFNPGQQGGNWGAHCVPRGLHLPATPVPLRETLWGLPPPLSLMFRVAVRVPNAVGLNVTLMLQLAPATNEVPQVWVCAKFPAFVPVIPMPMMLKVVVPTFVKVTVCDGLVVSITTEPKLKLRGESFAIVPTPLSVTFCGLPTALSVMFTAAVRFPELVGLNVMLMLQLAPVVNEVPHVWV